MIAIILAAGYATRMYPLTLNFPKPLLELGGKPILDWLCQDLNTCGIEHFYVVTNHKFYPNFLTWAANKPKVTILDDGTQSNETRLGALRDITFALDYIAGKHVTASDSHIATSVPEVNASPKASTPDSASGHISDCISGGATTSDTPFHDTLVLAGDNVLDFSFSAFLSYARQKGTSCVMRHYQPELSRLRRTGVCVIDDCDLILSMEEKPQNPQSNWAVPPFYYYTATDLPLLYTALQEGLNPDAPGSFVSYLAQRRPVHAFLMNGHRYDVGSIEGYEQLKATYKGISCMFNKTCRRR
jgi:glucose-1-phosphate thymidylyltransferase